MDVEPTVTADLRGHSARGIFGDDLEVVVALDAGRKQDAPVKAGDESGRPAPVNDQRFTESRRCCRSDDCVLMLRDYRPIGAWQDDDCEAEFSEVLLEVQTLISRDQYIELGFCSL